MPKQSHCVHRVPVHEHIRVEKRLLERRGCERSVSYFPRRVVEEEVKVRLKKKRSQEQGVGESVFTLNTLSPRTELALALALLEASEALRHPHYLTPLLIRSDDVQVVLHSYVCFSTTFEHQPLPSTTRPPAVAQPSHAPPPQRPSVSPAKEGSPLPTRRGGGVVKYSPGCGKEAHILRWVSGRALDFGGQSAGSNPPYFCLLYTSPSPRD